MRNHPFNFGATVVLTSIIAAVLPTTPVYASAPAVGSMGPARQVVFSMLAERALAIECNWTPNESSKSIERVKFVVSAALANEVSEGHFSLPEAAEARANMLNYPTLATITRVVREAVKNEKACEAATERDAWIDLAKIPLPLSNADPLTIPHDQRLHYAQIAERSCIRAGISLLDDRVTSAEMIAKAVSGECTPQLYEDAKLSAEGMGADSEKATAFASSEAGSASTRDYIASEVLSYRARKR